MKNNKNNVTTQAYDKAIAVLKGNMSPFGILASQKNKSSSSRRYDSIFARDIGVSSIGILASADDELIKSLKASLLLLAAHQASNGQIPNFIKPEIKQVDFWYLGCIDATLWWLIALKQFERHQPKDQLVNKLDKEIRRALNWLSCQEHPAAHLLQQNEASDWADILPRSGFVLYDNVLWLVVKNLYNILTKHETKRSINYYFNPWQKVPETYYKNNYRAKHLISYAQQKVKPDLLWLSYINFENVGLDGDLYANILASLSGVKTGQQNKMTIKYIISKKLNSPFPGKSLMNPVELSSKQGRSYMKIHHQNHPHQYHNGGIWPFIGGFWVLLLAQEKNLLCKLELERLASANQQSNWRFTEWLDSTTGRPRGMKHQSWSAAMYILAYQVVNQKFNFSLT
ncbi:MAG: glycoside hydrolase 100 family protein [Candidatus Falkowbacteria bacterium]